jgi:actin-like ATPase involved in cell morphogenesis
METMHSVLIEIPTLRNELLACGSGIRLSGGGALIPGFADRVAESVGLPVQVVRYPLEGVVLGARRILPIADKFDLWQHAVPNQHI